jgi:hypothetical protein
MCLSYIFAISASVTLSHYPEKAVECAKNEKPVVTIEKDPDTIQLENKLTKILGCATTIDLELGALIIKYGKNNEVLQGVLEHLGYEEF